MSKKSVRTFRELVRSEPALQARVATVMKEGTVDGLVKLGRENGHQFTTEDVKSMIIEISEGQKLNDFELVLVSGGAKRASSALDSES